jgi:hypothetical protein
MKRRSLLICYAVLKGRMRHEYKNLSDKNHIHFLYFRLKIFTFLYTVFLLYVMVILERVLSSLCLMGHSKMTQSLLYIFHISPRMHMQVGKNLPCVK